MNISGAISCWRQSEAFVDSEFEILSVLWRKRCSWKFSWFVDGVTRGANGAHIRQDWREGCHSRVWDNKNIKRLGSPHNVIAEEFYSRSNWKSFLPSRVTRMAKVCVWQTHCNKLAICILWASVPVYSSYMWSLEPINEKQYVCMCSCACVCACMRSRACVHALYLGGHIRVFVRVAYVND